MAEQGRGGHLAKLPHGNGVVKSIEIKLLNAAFRRTDALQLALEWLEKRKVATWQQTVPGRKRRVRSEIWPREIGASGVV